ncbi:MAG: hypothetical protein WB770_00560 [Acidimicrobiales bacterium]
MGAVRDSVARSRRGLTAPSSKADAPIWHGGWSVIERVGTPEELVTDQPEPADRRLACICLPTSGAVVLGSTQRPDEIDVARRRRAGYELSKRRSGGGAVVVAPGAQAWVDLFVPRDDPLFETDVSRAAHFVADLWVEVLTSSASVVPVIEPIRALSATRWSRSVCFSGLGPGEVTVAEKKVVGVSQRRDRRGAWFFTMALYENRQHVLAELLVLEEPERDALRAELSLHVGSLDEATGVLEDGLLRALIGAD